MVVAMIAVRVVQVPVNEVVDVVAMRDSLVATIGTMHMIGVVLGLVIGGADVRILITDSDHVLVHMLFVGMMQMPVMQIVDVPIVLDRSMAAILAVLVVVVVAGVGTVLIAHAGQYSKYS